LSFSVSPAKIPIRDLDLETTARGRHRTRIAGFMSRFEYSRDPLFRMAAAGYVLNQWLVKPLVPSTFLRGHFNDLLLIPVALPVVLCVQRLLDLRKHDAAPSWVEMALHLSVWSLICEYIGPFWLRHGTSDLWDVVAYAVGGVVACLWWNRPTHQTILRQQ